MKRTIYFFLFVLLVIVTVLFFFRLPIAAFLFTKVLEQAGAENIQFELAEISSKEIVISQAGCTLPGGGGKLSLDNARLVWNRSTFTTRQLDKVIIDTLSLDLPPKPAARSKTKFSIEPFVRHIERIVERLPFHELQIDHVTLYGQSAGVLAGQEFSLRLEHDNTKLAGELFSRNYNFRLTFNTPEQNLWALKLDQPGLAEPFLAARVKLQDNQVQTKIKADIGRLKRLPPFLNHPLPEMAGKLSGSLLLTLDQKPTAQITLALQQAAIAGIQADSIQLVLQGRMETPSKFLLENKSSLTISDLQRGTIDLAKLAIGLDGLIEKQNSQWQYTLDPLNKVSVSGLSGSNLQIESTQITPAMKVALSKKTITLHLRPEWQAQVAGVTTGSVTVAEASIRPEQNTVITLQAGDTFSWGGSPSLWQLTPNTVTLGNLTLTPEPIQIRIGRLDGRANRWQIESSLTSQTLGIKIPDNSLPLQDISAEFTAGTEGIKGVVSCRPLRVPGTLLTHFSHDLKNGAGKATLSTRDAFTLSETTPLSTLVTSWPLPGDLTGGRLQIQSLVHWQQKQPLQISLQAELSEGKGFFKEILFSGLATRQDLQILPNLQSKQPGIITIDEIGTGVTISDISTKIRFTPSSHGRIPKIEMKNLSASLFGGTLTDEQLSIDPQQLEIKNTIFLHGIDLSQLITIQSVKGLTVSGRIDGALPYQLDSSGLQIFNGTLQNTPAGGVIRYTPPGGESLSELPLTGYALKALEEFHYDHLSATAGYTPGGELRINLHLEGKSPKLETSRPVHLNINTEQNVLSLLQSLGYSKSLTDEIDKNLQRQYE